MNLDFLPLKSYTNITEGNALRMDWNQIVPKEELNYIMGNPPFVGHKLRTKEQAKDMEIMLEVPKYGKIDYVSAWYYKASEFIQNTKIKVSFVSTNSLCQGESVGTLWRYLIEKRNLEIQFAYTTFVWENEATNQAAVHCIIIGFTTYQTNHKKYIFENGKSKEAVYINAYLQDALDIFIKSRGQSITEGMPKMTKGNEATDGGNLSLTPSERKDIIVNPKVLVVPEATRYLFGVLESNVHMAWMRVVTGRLKSDFEYYPSVYNNFPFPNPTDKQKEKIEKTAQGILNARVLYPNSSLADLYDELTMPPELRKAHQENDKAVMEAYGFNWRTMTESDCVAELMKMYQKLVDEKK